MKGRTLKVCPHCGGAIEKESPLTPEAAAKTMILAYRQIRNGRDSFVAIRDLKKRFQELIGRKLDDGAFAAALISGREHNYYDYSGDAGGAHKDHLSLGWRNSLSIIRLTPKGGP